LGQTATAVVLVVLVVKILAASLHLRRELLSRQQLALAALVGPAVRLAAPQVEQQRWWATWARLVVVARTTVPKLAVVVAALCQQAHLQVDRQNIYFFTIRHLE
jgi:hypothetical protein